MPVYRLSKECIFPNPVLASKEGLLAVGGDLSIERLLLAYKNGIFPWFNEGEPILWWSPPKRMIIDPQHIHISNSMKKLMKKDIFTVTFDTCFEQVIRQCRNVRLESGTWITEDMLTAYIHLHLAGYAHSVEVWNEEKLVGGLYGVSLGRCFFGESMFSLVSNASKIAMIHLAEHTWKHGFVMIDCQMVSEHLQSLGGYVIERKQFLRILTKGLQAESIIGRWSSFQK